MNGAREIYEQFVTRGYARIQEAVESNESEGQFLDFKRADELKNISDVFAKAACGFANSLGGVIVWGIEAKSGKGDDPGYAVSEHSVPDAHKVLERINNLSATIASRPIPHIESHAITHPIDPSTGFVVTYVPESSHKPHQASGGLYYYRTGANTVKMGHPQIEALVLAKARPFIEVEPWQFSVQKQSPDSNGLGSSQLMIVIRAINVGSVPLSNISILTPDHRLRPYLGVSGSPEFYESTAMGGGDCMKLTLHPLRDSIRIFPGCQLAFAYVLVSGPLHEEAPVNVKFRLIGDDFSQEYAFTVNPVDTFGVSSIAYRDPYESIAFPRHDAKILRCET